MSKYRLTTQQERQLFQSAMVKCIKQNDTMLACKKIKSLYKKDQLYLFNWMCSIPNVLSKDDALSEIFDALDPKCKKPSPHPYDGNFKMLVSRLCATPTSATIPQGTLSLIKKAWNTFTEHEKTQVALWYMTTSSPQASVVPQKHIQGVVSMVMAQHQNTGPLYVATEEHYLKKLDNALFLLNQKAWDDFQKNYPTWIDFLKTEDRTPQIKSRLLHHEIKKQIQAPSQKSSKRKKM